MKKNILKIVAALAVVAFFSGVLVCAISYHRRSELSHMVGQMILVGFRGTSPGDAAVKNLAADIQSGKVGGVILFSVDVEKCREEGLSDLELRTRTKSRNIIDVAQVKDLNESLAAAASRGGRLPLLISIDQEGGMVVRLKPEHGFDMIIPSAKNMSTMPLPEIRDLYFEFGMRLKKLGFNLCFAPCVDVDINPQSPVIGALGRAFSADSRKVSAYAGVAAAGLHDADILSSYKHFPGHGSASDDTHKGIADVTNVWEECELEPYQNIPNYTMVMVAHVVNGKFDADYPASLSAKIINDLLRKKLGFNGVIISDDLQMGAIYTRYGLSETLRLAIMAGNDILLLGNNLKHTKDLGRIAHAKIMKMVENGQISRARVKESYDRIKKMKENLRK
ncbi:MAG: hypothetical protein LBI81_01570 [Puniceicoccales bacterium]|jgi:beta-N-acetylhexosaminidase|nr:hypothetical protein [Puniceicoccales bacterium]